MGHADYHHRHEELFFGYKPGEGRLGRGGAGWFGGNRQSSVLEVDRPAASRLHPTSKPVELIEICLRNSSRRGEVVLDPFAGSGSTLIACHRLGRRARLIEIDPRYAESSSSATSASPASRRRCSDGSAHIGGIWPPSPRRDNRAEVRVDELWVPRSNKRAGESTARRPTVCL